MDERLRKTSNERCDSTDFLHSLNKEKPFWHRILTTWYPSHPEIVSQLIQENVIQVSKEWLAQFLFVQHKGSILNETCQMLLSKGEDSLEGCTAHATLLELSNLSRLQLVTPKVQKKLSTKDVKPEIGTETDQENDLKIEEIPGALTQKPELKKDGKPKGKRVRVLKSLEDWSCWWSDDELDSAHFMWEQWSDAIWVAPIAMIALIAMQVVVVVIIVGKIRMRKVIQIRRKRSLKNCKCISNALIHY